MMNTRPINATSGEMIDKRKSNAIRVSYVMMAAFLSASALFIFLSLQTGLWQLNVMAGVDGVAFALSLFTLYLSRREKIDTAALIMIGAIVFSLPIAIGLIADLGILGAVGGIIGTFFISSLLLVQPLSGRALIGGVIVSVLTLLFDLFFPGERLSVKFLEYASPVIVVTGSATLGYLLFREFPNYPLRTKLMTAFVALSLSSVMVLGFISTTNTRNNLSEQSFQHLTETAESSAKSIGQTLSNQLSVLRTEAQIIDLVEYMSLPSRTRAGSVEENRALAVLQALGRKDPVFIESYALLDQTGKNLLDTVQEDIGRSEAGSDYLLNPLKTGLTFISYIRVDQDNSKPFIYLSAPIRNENGDFVGVLRVRYNANYIVNLLIDSTHADHEEEYAILVDNATFVTLGHTGDSGLIYKTYAGLNKAQVAQLQSNQRILSGEMEEVVIAQPELVQGIQNMENEPVFSAPTIYGNAAGYVGGSSIDLTNWTILIQSTERAVLSPVRDQTRYFTVVSLAIIVSAALLGWFLSQVLSRPLIQLSNVAGEIANGNLSVRAQAQAQDEIGALAKSFNYMTDQLFQTLTSLEQRVVDRTRALATSTEVSRRISTILDEKQLATEVVEQVQKAYNYYHGQIYLLDNTGQTLVLAGATGEGGRALLEKKHQLSIERGLVGRAARTKSSVLVPDTSQDPEWVPNPLLPDTKAEIAVPILLGEQLLGVLDMQDDVVGDIYPEDIEYLSAIANQVAIALQNSRSYSQARQRAERESLILSISQKIQSESPVDSALQVAIREVGRALGASVRVKLKSNNGEK